MPSNRAEENKRVRLQDIAACCGVSKMTVSLALRNHASISMQTRVRITDIAKKMGYNPLRHDDARRLGLRKSGRRVLNHVIAVVLPPHFCGSLYFHSVFEGIIRELAEAGYALVTTYYNFRSPEEHDRQPIDPLPPLLASGVIDGWLAVDIGKDLSVTMQYLLKNSFFSNEPVVSLLREHPGYSSVVVDEAIGMRELMRHLLELGHCHFLRFSHPYLDDVLKSRFLAMSDTLQEYGLSMAGNVQELPMPFGWVTGASHNELHDDPLHSLEAPVRLAHHLRAHPEVTALLAWNDISAAIAYDALTAGGFSVPDDISITGYDGFFLPMHSWANNVLTTVKKPLYAVGRESARLLIRLIEEQATSPMTIQLPTHLVVRQSTTCPRHVTPAP